MVFEILGYISCFFTITLNVMTDNVLIYNILQDDKWIEIGYLKKSFKVFEEGNPRRLRPESPFMI